MGFFTKLLHRPRQLWLRRVNFQIHLWTGVILAVYVSIIGVTGSILVFGFELGRLINPSPWSGLTDTPWSADISQVIDNIRTSYPHVHVVSLMTPTASEPVFIASLQQNGRTLVALHPTTGQLLGPVPQNHSWLDWVYDLHENLLAGRTGRVANAICAGALLLLSLTGLANWWTGLATWTRGLRVDFRRTWRRINFDLHSAIGFWSFAFLLIWSTSGIYFAWPAACLSLVNHFSPIINARPAVVTVDSQSEITRLDFHSMLMQAYALDPGTKWKGIIFPSSRRSPFQMLMSRLPSVGRDAEDTLFFNPYNGRYLSTYRYSQNQSLGDWIIWLQMPLHFGTHWGLLVKCIWAGVGLALPMLAITGILMYWNRVLSKRWRALQEKAPSLAI